MTPEARQVELEQFEWFSDMRRTPTQSWCQFHEVTWHPLIRFYFIARDYGINPSTKKLSPSEAVERYDDRLERWVRAAAETPPLP